MREIEETPYTITVNKKKLLIFSAIALTGIIFSTKMAFQKFSTYALETAQKPLNQTESSASTSYLDQKLTSIKNNSFRISELDSDLIIIDFWATWCPPCEREIPHFIELKNQYPNIEIIGISLDESKKDILSFSLIKELNYPIVHADSDLMKKIESDIGVITSIPTTFVYDKNLNLIEKVVGYRDKDYFEKLIPKS